MPEPLLSIVIPTRNRQALAMSMLRGFAKSPDGRAEVIVHDNSDDDSLGTMQAALGDPRIRYTHVTERLNMHGNMDRAIALARGRYVTAIGDDDGIILSEALAVLEGVAERDVDAVLAGIPGFVWPGTVARISGVSRGELIWHNPAAPRETILDPERELRKVFASGMVHSLGGLPKVYQGFVSRRSLQSLYARCGTYFPGASPDMANAVALVPFVNKILVTPQPAIISGHSPNSGGGAGSAGKHHGLLEEQTHLPLGTVELWNPALPRFWSGPTVYAQSALTARAATGGEAPPIGYHRLYATCLVYEPSRYWPLVFAALGQAPGNRALLAVRTAASAASLLAVRSLNLLRNLLTKRGSARGPQHADMESVMDAFGRRYTGNHFSG